MDVVVVAVVPVSMHNTNSLLFLVTLLQNHNANGFSYAKQELQQHLHQQHRQHAQIQHFVIMAHVFHILMQLMESTITIVIVMLDIKVNSATLFVILEALAVSIWLSQWMFQDFKEFLTQSRIL